MGTIKDTIDQLGILLPKTPEFESLTSLAGSLDLYAEGLVQSQKKMLTEMNDRMMATFAESMTTYDDMLTRLQSQFAAMTKQAPLADAKDAEKPAA